MAERLAEGGGGADGAGSSSALATSPATSKALSSPRPEAAPARSLSVGPALPVYGAEKQSTECARSSTPRGLSARIAGAPIGDRRKCEGRRGGVEAITSRRGTVQWQWAVVIVAIGLVYAPTPFYLPGFPGPPGRLITAPGRHGNTGRERGVRALLSGSHPRVPCTPRAVAVGGGVGTGFYVRVQARYRGAQCAAGATRSTA